MPPTVLAAEEQTAGRGRLGRPWHSAPGASATVSFARPSPRPLSGLEGASLACGLAVRDAIAELGVDASLKWPNDVLVDGRKLAGILVEVHATAAQTWLVVGIGVNVRALPDGGAAPGGLPPVDLDGLRAAPTDRNALVAALARHLDHRLATFDRDGFAPMADEWTAADAFRGCDVLIGPAGTTPRRVRSCGVDGTGALIVESPTGRERHVSGDLSLRPALAS